jgi:hypothetical protein
MRSAKLSISLLVFFTISYPAALLGAKDLGVGDDDNHAKMPPVNTGLLDGQLAWCRHDRGHTDAPNWKYFIPRADKFLNHEKP